MYSFIPEVFTPVSVILPVALLTMNSDQDREYLTQIYLDYRNLIYKVVLSFFPGDYNEAEDAFGSTLEKICKKADLLRSVSDAQKASYIAAMAANTCRDRLRQKKRSMYIASYDNKAMDEMATPADPYIQLFESSSMNEVLESWQSLTDNDRDIIRMRYAEGKTVPEISALLGVKEASIYSALFRARKRLAEHLKKEKSSS